MSALGKQTHLEKLQNLRHDILNETDKFENIPNAKEVLQYCVREIDNIALLCILCPLTSSENGMYTECIEKCCLLLQCISGYTTPKTKRETIDLFVYIIEKLNDITKQIILLDQVI